MTNLDRVFQQRILRPSTVLFMSLLCLSGLACSQKEGSSDGETQTPSQETTPSQDATGQAASDAGSKEESSKPVGPCALTKEEISDIINEEVTETLSSGNWGIASTCTYSTASAPVAVDMSSAATSDLSTDRMTEGAEDVPDLGDEAVWIPATSRLTVVDKKKNKLLRIGIGLKVSNEQKRNIAIAIAKLALSRL